MHQITGLFKQESPHRSQSWQDKHPEIVLYAVRETRHRKFPTQTSDRVEATGRRLFAAGLHLTRWIDIQGELQSTAFIWKIGPIYSAIRFLFSLLLCIISCISGLLIKYTLCFSCVGFAAFRSRSQHYRLIWADDIAARYSLIPALCYHSTIDKMAQYNVQFKVGRRDISVQFMCRTVHKSIRSPKRGTKWLELGLSEMNLWHDAARQVNTIRCAWGHQSMYILHTKMLTQIRFNPTIRI